MSGNSWANMGQECIKCHINVYPHKQVSWWSRAGGQGSTVGVGVLEGHREWLCPIGPQFTPSYGKDEASFPCLF